MDGGEGKPSRAPRPLHLPQLISLAWHLFQYLGEIQKQAVALHLRPVNHALPLSTGAADHCGTASLDQRWPQHHRSHDPDIITWNPLAPCMYLGLRVPPSHI